MDTIGLGRALRLINAGRSAVVLATLDPDEFAVARIPDSLRFDCLDEDCVATLHTHLRGMRHGTPILIYGRDAADGEPYRAAHLLEDEGFGPISVLGDGLAGWRAAGYRIASRDHDEGLMIGFEDNEREHHGGWPVPPPPSSTF